MTTPAVYDLFGLRLATELTLPCRRAEAEPETVVAVGPTAPIEDCPAPGDVLADYVDQAGRRWYSVSRQDGASVVRLPGFCDLTIEDTTAATFTPGPGTTDEMLAIMLAGTGVSAMLMLAGHPVLHGSAVVRDGEALAFLGDSGQGKSTLVARACMAGWTLLCDDVLRVEAVDTPQGGRRTICHPGGREIRLRPGASYDPSWPGRSTADDRWAVSPPSSPTTAQLGALVIPFPNREVLAAEASLLEPADALGALMRYSRIGGWTDNAMLAQIFTTAADIVPNVGVWVVQVPWEDRLDNTVIDHIAEAVLA